MQAFFADQFVLPLPPGHRFPMSKYEMLRQKVLLRLPEVRLCIPHSATDGELALGHHPDYIYRVVRGCLSPQALRAIGFPWSEAMVERSRRSTGATIGACRAAMKEGASANLAGGTHHAFYDRGEGFCVFNDTVVAARLLQAEAGRSKHLLRVLVIDLDVHQGNGTASITHNDPTIFTFSMHGSNNFPFDKQVSDLDIALADGTADGPYLDLLEDALARIDQRFAPGLVIYLAGVDAHQGDRLGKLGLSDQGIARRDQLVFEWCRHRQLPVAVTMAGGYSLDLEHMVNLQCGTLERLYSLWQQVRPAQSLQPVLGA